MVIPSTDASWSWGFFLSDIIDISRFISFLEVDQISVTIHDNFTLINSSMFGKVIFHSKILIIITYGKLRYYVENNTYFVNSHTGCFSGDAELEYFWPIIFLDVISIWTHWGLIRPHSKIVLKYAGCFRKVVDTKHIFFLMERPIFDKRFEKHCENETEFVESVMRLKCAVFEIFPFPMWI